MNRALSAFTSVVLMLGLAGFGLAGFGLAGSAVATETGRYVLKDVENGLIRLDTASGMVSHCGSRDGHWRCEPLADAQAALEDEIARLAEDNAALRQRLAELEAELRTERDSGSRLELPSEEEIDRVMSFFERFVRRLMDFARSLNQDPGRET